MSSYTIPRVGLGTWKLTGEECAETVATAIDIGYRHIDSAQMYGNEEAVGEGLRKASASRDEVLVATKINHRNLPAATPEEVFEATEESLDRLGVEYIDLLYVHWPVGDYDPEVTLPAMEELRADGRIKHIGLSNCTPAMVDAAVDALDGPLAAHQVEMHPLLQQTALHERAKHHGHALVAYSPLSHGDVFDVPELQSIAARHGLSEAQVSLAWLLSKDRVAAVPKASSRTHLQENLSAPEIELADKDIKRIDAIDREERFIDPEGAPWNRAA